MQQLSSLEQKIVNSAVYHRDNKPNKWSGTTNKFDEWYRVAYAHMLNKILPKVEHHLVNYWPTYFLWASGATHKRSFYEDRAYLYKEGVFGTGYTVLTRLLQQINKRIRENREKQAILSGTQELAFGKEQPNDTSGRTT